MSDENEFIILKNVRLAYAHMQPHEIRGKPASAGAQILLEKSDKQVAAVEEAIRATEVEYNKGKRIASDKYCLRSAEDRGRAGEFGDVMVLSANAKLGQSIMTMGKGSLEPILDPARNPIYSGCYANVKVRVWWQDNDYGKRINAALVAVQFADDGEPLDGSTVSAEEAAKGFEAASCDDAFDGGEFS